MEKNELLATGEGATSVPAAEPNATESRSGSNAAHATLIALVCLWTIPAIWLNFGAYNDDYRAYANPGLTRTQLVAAMYVTIILVGTFAYVHATRRSSGRTIELTYALGVVVWVAAHGGMSNSLASAPYSPRDWLSTTWYWSLDPLPIEIAEPMGWSPPVTDASGWGAAGLVGLQAYSVLLVIAGGGLLFKRWRDRS
jgi:hypothetical protein